LVQDPLLTVAYWLHMAATVVWIGGLFYYAVILIPVIADTEDVRIFSGVLERLRRRFNPIAWLSLGVLIVTGLMQMAGSPQYQGFLVIEDRWSLSIFLKHLAILLMVVLAAYQTWVIQPRLTRQLLLEKKRGHGTSEARNHEMTHTIRLTRINLVLGLIVLALTAIARTA
jgi:uncharacterized membrane protein